MIKVVSEDPSAPDAVVMLDELSDVLSLITGSSGKSSFDVNDVRVANARFVVARDQSGKAVGCGAFRPLESGIAEIKRMYSRRSMPGVGSAILSFLELEALKLGFAVLRLETRVVNEKAVTFYERRGYSCIPNFGKYVGKEEAVCFEKRLAAD
jgi:ribosomal protein S18 acetylase RimI-like enzyme